ncbi:MAG: SRPBCC family protein [Alphaproteobacteria bacterium]|nr:SRPBCC family protein [Alphaproteobacteria bacterium]
MLPLVVVGSANAHGPTRQKVTETVEINASPDKVWGVIKNFHDFSWHPAVEKTEGDGGNAEGAKRVVFVKGAGQLHEELLSYDEAGRKFKYSISKTDMKVLPVNNYTSTLMVEDAGDGKSKVTWKGAFYRGYMNNNPPADQNDAAAVNAAKGVYRGGLDGLKAKIEGAG